MNNDFGGLKKKDFCCIMWNGHLRTPETLAEKNIWILRKEDRIIDCFVDSSRAILNPEKDRTVSETVRQLSSGRTMCERKVSGNYTYPSRVGQKIFLEDPIKGQKGKEL